MAGIFNIRLVKHVFWIFTIFICLSSTKICYSQQSVIQGKVVDISNNKPVSFANVYFNNSLTGTTTDTSGKFLLKNLNAGAFILIVSFVGYEPYRQSIRLESTDTLTINVHLNPSIQQLSGVEIKGKMDVKWNRQLRKFKNHFFGSDVTSRYCEILNPEYLSFYEDPETGLFTAESNVPLEIINHRLGYKIYFSLKEFSAHRNRLKMYYGDTRFEELLPETVGELASWKANRYSTYKGSLRHFFSALINNSVIENGFLVNEVHSYTSFLNFNRYSDKIGKELQPIDRTNMILLAGNPKIRYLVSVKPIEIIYTERFSSNSPYPDKPYEVSRIVLKNGGLEVNTNGFVSDPTAFIVYGNRAGERAADMLPFEYEPPGQPEVIAPGDLNELYFTKLDSLSKEVSGKGKLWGQEDVFISTDKPYYVAGDEIWYSTRLIDNFSKRCDEGERIVYVDLISPEDSVIVHQTLPSIDGLASGHIQLPEYIPDGCYLLSGYTNWMRNYSDEVYTGKTVRIYSKTRFSVDQDKEISENGPIIVNFYPEGGHMINSLENVVAIKAVTKDGKGVSINGILADDRDREIKKIKTNAYGIGKISFEPRHGRQYYIKPDPENLKNTNFLFSLPEIEKTGYKMSVLNHNKNTIEVHIETTSDLKNHGAILIVQSGGRIFLQEAFFLEGTEKKLILSKSQVPGGVVQLNLFDLEGKLIGQRLIYNDPVTESPVITIKTEKSENKPDEEVGIRISFKNDKTIPVDANLVVSVTANDLFDISSYSDPIPGTMLQSVFFEDIQNPGYYFGDTTEDLRLDLDNLLMTLTDYRYDWLRINIYQDLLYEKRRMLQIRGRALVGKKDCSGCEVNLFPVGKDISFLTFTTDENGEFSTVVPGLFNSATYIAQIVNMRGSVVDGNIELYDHEHYNNGKRTRECITLTNEHKVEKYFTLMEEIKAEREKMRTIMLKEVSVEGKKVDEPRGLRKFSDAGMYGTADMVIDIGEEGYRYSSVTDAIVRNVSGFIVKPDNMDPGNYKLQLHGPGSFNFFSEEVPNNAPQGPLFVLDGVELGSGDDAYLILKSIPPVQVEKIEVFKFGSAAMWGSRGANGVIVIYTRQGKDNAASRRNVLKIEGFTSGKSFRPMEQDSTGVSLSKRITVYWADHLKTDSNGEINISFRNPTNAEFFTVRVEGITEDGIPFRYVKITDL